ncbi:MAG: VCBS repeat-containing protein [Bacteroidetes bacterium]|nr:VCBS repeat-containing protein [Bacteroidota bacterium]
MKIRSILACFAVICAPMCVRAGQSIILRHYNPRSPLQYYQSRDIVAQAARFDLSAPAVLRELRISLGGPGAKGGVRLHIYGGEFGLQAPGAESDLIPPIILHKSHAGIEQVHVALPDGVHLRDQQFFVVVDNIDPGVRLLSDHVSTKAVCVGNDDGYYHQLLKYRDGHWEWGKYAFAIEAVVEHAESQAAGGFADIASLGGMPDSLMLNNGIAWADYDNDGLPDVLAGGRLYRNRGGDRFEDVTVRSGITARPILQAFLDADNDGHVDVLTFDSVAADGISAALYRNTGDGSFERRPVHFAGIGAPSCFSVADANGDGALDIFIGSPAASGSGGCGMLYLGSGHGTWSADTTLFSAARSGSTGISACEWSDINRDGWPDLYLLDMQGRGTVWLNREGRNFDPMAIGSGGDSRALPERSGGARVPRAREGAGRVSDTYSSTREGSLGCAWADYDGDGHPDLLVPGNAGADAAGLHSMPISSLAIGSLPAGERVDAASGLQMQSAARFPYVAEQGGGAWGDANNDALLDFIVASACPCSFVQLYEQGEGHRFENHSWARGLWRVSGGPDAVWVDYNNDGRLDLCMIEGGRLHLLKNQLPEHAGNSVTVELRDAGRNTAGVGALVTVYAQGTVQTREVTSGRGRGVQDPLRLHFGIGAAHAADSVIVRWPDNGGATTQYSLAANKVHVLNSGREGAGERAITNAAAFPNPFQERLTFQYHLSISTHVRIELYDAHGTMAALVLDENQTAGDHTIPWTPSGDAAQRLAQGTYLYRIATSQGEVTGKLVLEK